MSDKESRKSESGGSLPPYSIINHIKDVISGLESVERGLDVLKRCDVPDLERELVACRRVLLENVDRHNEESRDTDELIDLLEEAEGFLEDLSLGYYTDLQMKLSKTRYRLLKEREEAK